MCLIGMLKAGDRAASQQLWETYFRRLAGRARSRRRNTATEGFTNRKIADRIACVEHTVARRLRSIRQLWSGEGLP